MNPSRPFSPSEQGRRTEAEARVFLEAKGYAFLAANHLTRMGEVDLVMRDGETLVFVEVRRRMNTSFGHGFETVTWAKQAKVAKAALAYAKEKGLTRAPMRFDIVSQGPKGLEHIPNAFVPPAGRYSF